MNELQKALMDKPSIDTAPRCTFCGKLAQSRHHIVPRSQGGAKGPTVTVCGSGNESGCHGLLHSKILHLRWNDGWEYLRTSKPTNYLDALDMEGWTKL